MLGMVLAAGVGRRLLPHTEALPKALLPVHGQTTILDIALHNMAAVGLSDVVVVVGYRADAVTVRQSALEARHGVRLEFVHNHKAEEWNNCYSLWLAREFFAEAVLLTNGDTVHPVGVQQTLLANRGRGVLLAVDVEKKLGQEEMKVTFDEGRLLRRISKLMPPGQAQGEYIGLTLIEPSAAVPLAEALEATFRRDPSLYYEDGYQELVDRGGEVAAVPIGTVPWVEVDTHEDLSRAQEIACHY